MTLADGTELSPALGIGAFAEKTLVAAGQCTKVDPAAPPTAAGLLGCGVMAGIGAAINTGDVEPRRHRSPCSAAAASATPRSPAAALAGAHDDHRRRHRRPQAGAGPRSFGATHTVNSSDDRPGRGDPGADRRLRRRRRASTRSAARRSTSRRSTPATSPARVVLVGVPDART